MATAAPTRGLLARMGMRKSVAQVQRETETSELKRSLGPVEPGVPRHRLHHRRRHFRPHRQRRGASRRPGRAAVVRHRRHRLRLRRPVLCRAVLDPAGVGLGLHLQLRDHRRVRRLGHGRVAAARIWPRGVGRRGRLVGLCRQPARRHRASTFPPQLTGPMGYPKELARRHRPSPRCSTCPPSWSARCLRCCWSSAFRNRPRSTTSSSRSRSRC